MAKSRHEALPESPWEDVARLLNTINGEFFRANHCDNDKGQGLKRQFYRYLAMYKIGHLKGFLKNDQCLTHEEVAEYFITNETHLYRQEDAHSSKYFAAQTKAELLYGYRAPPADVALLEAMRLTIAHIREEYLRLSGPATTTLDRDWLGAMQYLAIESFPDLNATKDLLALSNDISFGKLFFHKIRNLFFARLVSDVLIAKMLGDWLKPFMILHLTNGEITTLCKFYTLDNND